MHRPHTPPAPNRLLAFYRGHGGDDRGRRLHDILAQDDRWLESTHDYIQWLFPLREPSRVTPDAPLIDADVVQAFAGDEALRGRLQASLDRMLAFYGLHRENGRIASSPQWPARRGNWFTQPTHNSLRITRILKSCVALGLRDEATLLLDALERLCAGEADCGVGETTLGYWRAALADGPRA